MKDKFQTPKGMRDVYGEDYFIRQGLIEKASEIALYYGFKPIETPILEEEALFTQGIGNETDVVSKEMYTLKTRGGDKLALRPEGTAPVMRAYFENGLVSWPQPVMLYYSGAFFRHDNPQRGRWREFQQFGLEVIGSSKSIMDAMIIMITKLILEEVGLENLRVEINSIGDKDCRPIYRRELVNYYRKHLKDICAGCRERLKDNPLRVLDCKNEKCQQIKLGAPGAISYLCAPCKEHLKEVLEYLEAMQIGYELNQTLVRGLDYYSRTVFEISNNSPQETFLALGSGGRYDYLSKNLGYKKNLPAVGSAIGVDRVLQIPGLRKLSPRIVKKPKVFFIQLSFEAKLRSFQVIEILREAKVPLAQSLSKDSLGVQLAIAEKMAVPYTIIMGQKEALEESIIVRDMENRSQHTIKITNLSEYIKKIK